MDYYRDTVTQKSWELLLQLKKNYEFVLIGGWAVWLYTQQLKSKDIDIVVELNDLEKLKGKWTIEKNERLRKYQFRQDEVEVDVYAPYYSDLGVPVEVVALNKQLVEGLWVPRVELMLALKAVSLAARRGSAKGQKDWLDIISLLDKVGKFEVRELSKWRKYETVDAGLRLVVDDLRLTTEVKELGLNRHQMAKSKKKWMEFLV